MANEGNVTIALDVTITDDLRSEGLARDLVNRIQNIRKGRGYDITDRIDIVVEPVAEIVESVKQYEDYIVKQVLAKSIEIGEVGNAGEDELLDIDGLAVKISVSK